MKRLISILLMCVFSILSLQAQHRGRANLTVKNDSHTDISRIVVVPQLGIRQDLFNGKILQAGQTDKVDLINYGDYFMVIVVDLFRNRCRFYPVYIKQEDVLIITDADMIRCHI